MKNIIITESQKNRLIKEAIGFGFSFERLKNMTSFKKRIEFCKEYLGFSIGRGSSRLVFQLNDNWVLKLAINEKGIAQNEEEYGTCMDSYNPISVNVNDKLSDTDNFYFIVSEFVLKATNGDFKHIIGMSFDEFVGFINKTSLDSLGYGYYSYKFKRSDEEYVELIENNENIYDFYEYIGNYCPDESTIGDMSVINNYGIVNRNGDATIVMLDTGINNEIYNNYYRRGRW